MSTDSPPQPSPSSHRPPRRTNRFISLLMAVALLAVLWALRSCRDGGEPPAPTDLPPGVPMPSDM